MSGDFERAIELDVDDPPYLTAVALHALGRADEAIALCRAQRAAPQATSIAAVARRHPTAFLEGEHEEGMRAVAGCRRSRPSLIPKGSTTGPSGRWARRTRRRARRCWRRLSTLASIASAASKSAPFAALRESPAFGDILGRARVRQAGGGGAFADAGGPRLLGLRGANPAKSHVASSAVLAQTQICVPQHKAAVRCACRRDSPQPHSTRLVNRLRVLAWACDPALAARGSHHDAPRHSLARGSFMIGDRLLRVSHHAFILCWSSLSAIVLTAQTVVDPRYVEFTPSADHRRSPVTARRSSSATRSRYSSSDLRPRSTPWISGSLRRAAASSASTFCRCCNAPSPEHHLRSARHRDRSGRFDSELRCRTDSRSSQRCAPSINSTGQSVGSGVATGSVGVTAGAGCTWSAVRTRAGSR